MYTCAQCAIHACGKGEREQMPKNCPMRQEALMEQALGEYEKEENHQFHITSSEMEAEGYCQWPRLRETVEMCKRMGYRKVGLAFCLGLRKEAKVVDSLLRREGLEVVSVICKAGGVPKEAVGITRKVRPDHFEATCNPIAQAKLLNEQGTQFNIVLGLCVGHDSLFYKYSEALVTTLVVKDRVLAHNPVGAIYCAEGYFRDRLKTDGG